MVLLRAIEPKRDRTELAVAITCMQRRFSTLRTLDKMPLLGCLRPTHVGNIHIHGSGKPHPKVSQRRSKAITFEFDTEVDHGQGQQPTRREAI